MKNILKIRELSKRYQSVQAVNNLSLNIPKGSVFGLLGPNGSGKTTTLGMILGVITPTHGSFNWFGQPLNFSTKQKIGAILETPNFYPYLSAIDNLKIVAQIKEIPNPDIEGVLEKVNLSERANSKFKTYSLGMKQRLAIASALLCDPQVLILDEPTNGLDPQGIVEIRDIIRDIAGRGITIILASHLLDEVEKVCTHTAVLRKGQLLFSGTVEELTGAEGLVEVSSSDIAALEKALQQFPGKESISSENGKLRVILRENADAAGLNKFLTDQGIYADHLVFRKNSLEEQFIQLIKN